jgi:hypothetical protein
MEIFLGIVGIGFLMLAYKGGLSAGRQQVLQNLSDRLQFGLQAESDFSRKFGIRGMYLVLDYLGPDAKLGTGFESPVANSIFVVHAQDFEDRISRTKVEYSNVEEVVEPEESLEPEEILEPQNLHLFAPNSELARMIGQGPMTRSEATRRVWNYIDVKQLRNPDSPRTINCDAKLSEILRVQSCTIFNLVILLSDGIEKAK